MILLRTLRYGFNQLCPVRPGVIQHRFQSQLIPRDEPRTELDPFIHQMRSATNASDVFGLVHNRGKAMQLPQIITAMKSLFELHKMGMSTSTEIASHPGFEELCKRLKMKCRTMEFNEIVEVIKILSVLGVQPNSEIYHSFLDLAKQEINRATLMQIVFLDFILQKVDAKKNPLVAALRLSFPIIFQMHIGQQTDHENVPQLIDYLGFISRNRVNRKTALIVMNALILHGDTFSAEEARKIAWSLCDDVNPCSEQREKLFSNVMDCLSMKLRDLSVEILENTVSKMAKKYAKHPNMYHERFLNETANLLLERELDFTRISYFLKGFNRMSFVHPKLFHHLLTVLLHRDPTLLETCRPTTILSVFGAFSNANFRTLMPNFKNVLVPSLFANPHFSRDLIEFPWTKLACDFASLDIFDRGMKDKVLSVEFLEPYLARESTIDYLQFLKFYQSVVLLDDEAETVGQDLDWFLTRARNVVLSKVDFPLKTSLEFAFGGQEYVATKVLTRYHHLIDHILQFNENKDICKINLTRREDGTTSLEDIQSAVVSSTKTVAVMGLPQSYFTNLGTIKGAFDLQLRTLEKTGAIIVVPIDLQLWMNLNDREKIPFLQREIKAKL